MRVRSAISNHPLVFAALTLAITGFLAFVVLYFEPQALFIDDRVDEPLPTVAATAPQADPDTRPPQVRVLARGGFTSYEHSTTGTARVLRLQDGSRYLRFEDFETSNGPDVRVYLSAAPAGGDGDAFDDSYVELGELKGNIGNQNYEIPRGVNFDRLGTAVIWCKRFSVAFGAASLR